MRTDVRRVHGDSGDNRIALNAFSIISGDPIRFRHNCNYNTVEENRFAKTGLRAVASDWFSIPGGDECPSWGSDIRNNEMNGTYDRSLFVDEQTGAGYWRARQGYRISQMNPDDPSLVPPGQEPGMPYEPAFCAAPAPGVPRYTVSGNTQENPPTVSCSP